MSVAGEKRCYGYDLTPVKKRLKIGDLSTLDNALKLQIDGKGTQYYCLICDCWTDHNEYNCHDSSKGMGMACSICCEPCEIEEHILKWKLQFKFCACCHVNGNHWSNECPDPEYDDDFDEEEWY